MKSRRFMGLVIMILLSVALSVRADGPGEDGIVDSGSGGSSFCTYCSESRCGCASADVGYMLSFSCTCSSIQCTRSCTYTRM